MLYFFRLQIICYSLCKTLHKRGKLQWPKKVDEAIEELSEQQYRWLLEGLSIFQTKAVKEAKAGYMF